MKKESSGNGKKDTRNMAHPDGCLENERGKDVKKIHWLTVYKILCPWLFQLSTNNSLIDRLGNAKKAGQCLNRCSTALLLYRYQ